MSCSTAFVFSIVNDVVEFSELSCFSFSAVFLHLGVFATNRIFEFHDFYKLGPPGLCVLSEGTVLMGNLLTPRFAPAALSSEGT